MASTGYDTFTEASDTFLESHTSDSGTQWVLVKADSLGTNLATVLSATDELEATTSGSATGYAYKLGGSAAAGSDSYPIMVEADLKMSTSANTEFNGVWCRGSHSVVLGTGDATLTAYGAALIQSGGSEFVVLGRWNSVGPGAPLSLALSAISGYSGTTYYNVRLLVHNDGNNGSVHCAVFLDDVLVIEYTDTAATRIQTGELVGVVFRKYSGTTMYQDNWDARHIDDTRFVSATRNAARHSLAARAAHRRLASMRSGVWGP